MSNIFNIQICLTAET